MSPNPDTSVLYSAVLRPHRSADRRAIGIVVGLIGLVSAAVGGVFLAMGAWPVLPFLGGEVVLLYILLRLNLSSGNVSEAINLTRSALTVRQTDAQGRQNTRVFRPHWLQVNLERREPSGHRVELRSGGRSVIIGELLAPHERVTLALALRRALAEVNGAGR